MMIPKVAEYIEQNLTVGQGRYAGQPFKLLNWQKRFLRGAFSSEGSAALTLGRGNGKSTFASAIARCCMTPDAPLHEPMADNMIVASTFAQGGVLFRHLLHFLAPELEAHKRDWRVVDSANQMLIEYKPTKARMAVLGANPKAFHGYAPRLILIDELAQWQHTQIERSLAGLVTSMGKIPDSRYIAIGTRPARSDHPFERMLNGGTDFAMSFAARKGDPPFQRRTWKRANPSLDHLPDLEKTIRKEANLARQDESLVPQFEALHLNLGVSDTAQAMLLDADTWTRLERLPDAPREGAYILGLDLGANAAMTAAAAYWTHTGRLECFAVFPERPSLPERGLKDGVGALYQRMHNRGELHIAGDRLPDYAWILRKAIADWGVPVAIAADRFKENDLLQVLEGMGFPQTHVVWRGMGFRDGGEDVRQFRAACLENRVKPLPNLLLRAAMSESVVDVDAAGNSKLVKQQSGGRGFKPRDDAAAAAILAVAEGIRYYAMTAGRAQGVRFVTL